MNEPVANEGSSCGRLHILSWNQGSEEVARAWTRRHDMTWTGRHGNLEKLGHDTAGDLAFFFNIFRMAFRIYNNQIWCVYC